MQTVMFYTKLNCGLCDKAYTMLMQVALDMPLEIDIIDIMHGHHKLSEKYHDRIPVIATPNANTELNWPFSVENIKAYLNQYRKEEKS